MSLLQLHPTMGGRGRDNGLVWGVTISTTATLALALGGLVVSWALPSWKKMVGKLLEKYIALPLKAWIIKHGGIEKQLLVVLPPQPKEETNGQESITSTPSSSLSPSSMSIRNDPHWTLLMIFPGGNCHAEDYLPIAKVLQKQYQARFGSSKSNTSSANNGSVAGSNQLVVAIGMDRRPAKRSLWHWALNQGDPKIMANLLQLKAEQMVKGINTQTTTSSSSFAQLQKDQIYNSHLPSHLFQDVFLWGHSAGGLHAIPAALPSKFRGLIFYGCTMSITGQNEHDKYKLLASYPRPVLTLMGERDGNLRYLRVAKEAQELRRDCQQRIQSTSVHNRHRGPKEEVKRACRVRKPIIVLPELNHMQMTATGKLPLVSLQTGRADFTSYESLDRAHARMAQVALDFMQVHSTMPRSTPKATITATSATSMWTEAQTRLLQLGKNTHVIHLQPWLRLTEQHYQLRFVAAIQRQLLHITTGASKFHFYEDDHAAGEDDDSEIEDPPKPDIVPQFHLSLQDFLYSRPQWDSDTHQLTMTVMEQDPISISIVPQMAPTLAFKGRSQEELLFNQNSYQEIKDSPAPTLMELNQQTFDRILHHLVTPTQRRRYLTQGKKLRFGPDMEIPRAPDWVTQPISITKVMDGATHYYLWQSTYTTTPISLPAPFGGAWYGKPLSPAQAYEWIVFDAFKP